MARTRTHPQDYKRRITRAQWETSWEQFEEAKRRLIDEGRIQAYSSVFLQPISNTGHVVIGNRKYKYVTSATWKRIRRLVDGHGVMPGSWAYSVPRGG